MICPNCKQNLEDGSKFCFHCGAKQPEVSVTEPVAPAPAPVAAEPVAPAPVAVAPVPPAAPVAAPKKKRGFLLPIILGAAGLVVIAVILGCLLLLKGSDDVMMAYTTEDGELMFLKNLSEKTEAVEIDDEGAEYLLFSQDGKYVYFVSELENQYTGTLYRMQISKIGKKGERPEKIDKDVYPYLLRILENGNLLYETRDVGGSELFVFDGKESERIAKDYTSFGGVDADEKYVYYIERNYEDYTECLYRTTLDGEGKEELLVEDADNIYNSYQDDVLLYSREEYVDDRSIYTIYSKAVDGKEEKLVEGVASLLDCTVEDEKVSFYYTVYQEETYSLFDYVTYDQEASDAASTLTEPAMPDKGNDYTPWYGLYEDENGRIYYESYSRIKYYLDFESYPDMSDVDVAYAMAEDLYAAAYAEYETAYNEWYAIEQRKTIAQELKNITSTNSYYSLYVYEDGESKEIAKRALNIKSGYYSDIFVYEKTDEVITDKVADVSELEYAYQVYDLMDSQEETRRVYYQNIGGVESVLDLEEEEFQVSSVYELNDESVILTLYDGEDSYLYAYTVRDNVLVNGEEITDEYRNLSLNHAEETLYFFTNVDMEKMEGDLMSYRDGKCTEIASDVSVVYMVGEKVYTLSDVEMAREYSYNRSGEFSLLDKKGKAAKIEDDVDMYSVDFCDENTVVFINGQDLYIYDGKEARRITRDVNNFWCSEYVGSTYKYLN